MPSLEVPSCRNQIKAELTKIKLVFVRKKLGNGSLTVHYSHERESVLSVN